MSCWIERAERKFSDQLASLQRIADLNRAAAEAVFDLDQRDPEMACLTCEAIARGIAQLVLLKPPLVLMAGAYEDAAAAGVALRSEG